MANESPKTTVGLPIGTRIGKYEVKERLAIGGQAIIYKCYDSLLDRDVAIKQVSSHLAEDPKFLEHFRKEAQTLARLGARQPAIVSIFELIEDERGLFIVMEHVKGNTLETILQDNPQPVEPKATLQILWRLAAALHDVHVAGIIHRDIKPANIIIGEGLRPKITDFGVAASLSGQTSMLLGTTRYMAPELLSGQRFDGRADMYSLGFIAYEMLVGREKFNEIFADILRDKHSEALRWMKWHSNSAVVAPAVHEVNPSVPKSLSDIIAKMMAKDPEQRFEGMESLGRAIKAEFSPRTKAGAAAAEESPRRSSKRHHRRVADASAVVAQAHAMRHDDGDELVIQGPATAQIPKKKLSKRTKLVLLGTMVGVVVLGALIALIVKTGQDRELAQARTRAYEVARQAYDEQGNYDRALKFFKEVSDKYPNTDEAAKASVMIPLTEAQIAVQDKEWERAKTKQDEAQTQREKLHKLAKGALLDWTRDILKETDAFSKKRTTMQDYTSTLVKASAALADSQYKEASDIIADAKKKLDLKEDQMRELRALDKKIKIGEFRSSIEASVNRGQDLASKGNYDEAETAYKDAMGQLAADENKALTKDEVLTKDDRKGLSDVLNNKIKQLGEDRELAKLMADAAVAEAAGDLKTAADSLEKADKLKPKQVAVEQKLNDLKAKIALQEGQSLESQRKFTEARKKYVDSLRFSENAEARAGLDRLKKGEDRATKIASAHAAFDAGNFAEAMKLYEDVIKGGGEVDEVVKERLRECKYNLLMAEADKLRDAKQFDDSMKKYEEARAVKQEAGPIIDERVGKLKTEQEYTALVTEGTKLLNDGQWGKAIEQLTAAQKKKDTEDVRRLLKLTKFRQVISMGKGALERSDPNSAVTFFKVATTYAETDAEKKQVEDLIKQAEDQVKPPENK